MGLWTKSDYEMFKMYCDKSENIIWDETTDYGLSYKIADCVFTDINCGIIVSALTLDKPMCILRRFDGRDCLVLHPDVISHHNVVNNPEELFDFLERVNAGEDPNAELRRDALNKFVSHYDGKNGQRIKDSIESEYIEKFSASSYISEG
jgi:hypothetical protein